MWHSHFVDITFQCSMIFIFKVINCVHFQMQVNTHMQLFFIYPMAVVVITFLHAQHFIARCGICIFCPYNFLSCALSSQRPFCIISFSKFSIHLLRGLVFGLFLLVSIFQICFTYLVFPFQSK